MRTRRVPRNQARHPATAHRRRRSIINTSSGGGLLGHGQPSIHVYCAAKAAIINLTQSAAVALGKDRIRVNCICPGWTSTPPIYASFPGGKAEADQTLAGLQPLARAGQPEDIAAVALFLASDESSWLTGVAVPADGGQSARCSSMMMDVPQFAVGMGGAAPDRR